MEFRPRARHFLTKYRRERERVRAGCANDKRPPADRLKCALGVNRLERNISRRPDGQAHVVPRAGIADEAHDLKANTRACRVHLLERLSDWILTAEILLRESLVDDRDGGIRVGRAKVSAVELRNLHRVRPAGRDTQEI